MDKSKSMTAEEILKKHLDGWWKAQIGHHPHIENVLTAMEEYAKLKCEKLLEIVAEEAESYVIGGLVSQVDEESILNAVDLDEFIK